MPTKERNQREAEKRQQAEQEAAELAEFDRQLAALSPEHLAALRALGGDNNDLIFELPPYMRLKPGLIGFDEDGNVWLSPEVGAAGSAANTDNALDRAKSLKNKFPKLWGNGDYAEYIARQSVSAIGLDEPLSAKTIRRYFKRVP